MGTMPENMEKFMVHDKQRVIPPFIIQETRMKVDDIDHQVP